MRETVISSAPASDDPRCGRVAGNNAADGRAGRRPVAARRSGGARRCTSPTSIAAAANAAAWREALPDALVAYAVKANPDPALLRRLAADGFGFEVVGPVELALALRAGATARADRGQRRRPDRCGPASTALASGALVNAESLGALDALLAAGPGRIGLRLNPGIDADDASAPGDRGGRLEVRDRAGRAARGGSRRRRAAGSAARLGRRPHRLRHLRSASRSPRLAALLGRVAASCGADRIDLGGGFAGDPAAYAAVVRPHLSGTGALIVEPGRSIVADAGWLLTRVVRVQERGHLVADAGMTELLRPMLVRRPPPGGRARPRIGDPFGANAGRWPGRSARPATSWPTTSTSAPAAGEGALLAIGEVGAYGRGDGVELQRPAATGAGGDRGRRGSPQPPTRDARGPRCARRLSSLDRREPVAAHDPPAQAVVGEAIQRRRRHGHVEVVADPRLERLEDRG